MISCSLFNIEWRKIFLIGFPSINKIRRKNSPLSNYYPREIIGNSSPMAHRWYDEKKNSWYPIRYKIFHFHIERKKGFALFSTFQLSSTFKIVSCIIDTKNRRSEKRRWYSPFERHRKISSLAFCPNNPPYINKIEKEIRPILRFPFVTIDAL